MKRFASVMILCVLVSSCVPQRTPVPTATAMSAPTGQPEPTAAQAEGTPPAGIGITRDAVQSAFESNTGGFAFQPAPDAKGQPRVIGQSEGATAWIELIGAPEELTEASVLVESPPDAPNVFVENRGYMARFVTAVAPDWIGGPDWVANNLHGPTDSVEVWTTFEDLVITLRAHAEIGMAAMTVKAAP